jgi:beta-lactamase class A
MISPQPKLIFIGVISMLCFFSCVQKKATIEDQIRKELSKQPGVYGLAFKDLSTGEELFINEHEVFHAASTMKTPVMIEVFKQAKEGRFSLSDSVPIKNSFKSIVDGSVYSLDSAEDSIR